MQFFILIHCRESEGQIVADIDTTLVDHAPLAEDIFTAAFMQLDLNNIFKGETTSYYNKMCRCQEATTIILQPYKSLFQPHIDD